MLIVALTAATLLVFNVLLIMSCLRRSRQISVQVKRAETALALMQAEDELEGKDFAWIKNLPGVFGTEKIPHDAVSYIVLLLRPNNCNSCLASTLSIAEELYQRVRGNQTAVLGVSLAGELYDIMRLIRRFDVRFPVFRDTTRFSENFGSVNILTPAFAVCDSSFMVINAHCAHFLFPERTDRFYRKLKSIIHHPG